MQSMNRISGTTSVQLRGKDSLPTLSLTGFSARAWKPVYVCFGVSGLLSEIAEGRLIRSQKTSLVGGHSHSTPLLVPSGWSGTHSSKLCYKESNSAPARWWASVVRRTSFATLIYFSSAEFCASKGSSELPENMTR